MKLLKSIFVLMLIFSSTLFVFPSAFANTCTYSEKYYTLPQIFTLSSYVFEGTVTSITNNTDNQWDINFSMNKPWKGEPSHESLIVKTNSLQGCGYSITTGQKYLVYTINSVPFLQISWTKVYTDAQSDIAIISDPSFQTQEKNKENLNEKIAAAREIVESMMLNNTLGIPLNLIGVDTINSTLNIGIDDTKATLSSEEYKEKIKSVIGDIPIKIIFGQNILDKSKSDENNTGNLSSTSIMFPLKQFKSGVAAPDVICKQGLQLIFKTENNSPACVKPDTAQTLIERGWAKPI